ncbi:MAG: flagellar motor switch protein FliG [Gammaproteobacteria bacterium]|nr:flagellar motor switch protein FliG [Gammaproteobacteria bacterium]
MSELAEREMNGTERAALLLMTLGEKEAAEVLKFMGAQEVQALGMAMASLKNVSRNQADLVLNGFITDVEDQTTLGVDTENYVRSILGNAFGQSKANAFIDRIMTGDDAKGLDALKWMSSRDVVEIVKDEHPQIIAIVLAYLESAQAADVVERLPEEIRSDILMRVAGLTDIQQSALAEIESLIASKSTDASGGSTRKVGGDKIAADIVNALKPARGEEILDQIKEKNAELSERIQEMMFTFDTLLNVDDRGIQSLLREVSNDLLTVALKGCDPAISTKITGNMSKRAATLLKEDMEAKGPMKLSDVESAQKEILDVARRLADAGDIDLGQGNDEYV